MKIGTSLVTVAALAAGLFWQGNTAAQTPPLVSTAGYYEGQVTYAAEYFKDRPAMSMHLRSQADFWFLVTPNGELSGEGIAHYEFDFGIDWGMAAKMGFKVMKVMGASIDPSVTLTLNPKTAVHNFYLTGQVEQSDSALSLVLSWLPPGVEDAELPKLHLNLVASLSGTITASNSATAASATVGGSVSASTILHTIEQTPLSPFGTDRSEAVLQKRSVYGPYATAFSYDGAGGTESTGLTVDWQAAQKIDFAQIRLLAALFERLDNLENQAGIAEETGQSGAPGAPGTPGASGENAAGDGFSSAMRAGRVLVSPGEHRVVRFRTPMPNSNYVIAFSTDVRAPGALYLRWSDKTPQGFTILAEVNAVSASSAVSDGAQGNVNVDWITTEISE